MSVTSTVRSVRVVRRPAGASATAVALVRARSLAVDAAWASCVNRACVSTRVAGVDTEIYQHRIVRSFGTFCVTVDDSGLSLTVSESMHR